MIISKNYMDRLIIQNTDGTERNVYKQNIINESHRIPFLSFFSKIKTKQNISFWHFQSKGAIFGRVGEPKIHPHNDNEQSLIPACK